jgi:hypothetical protein
LKQFSRYWLAVGTITLIVGSFGDLEPSLTYLLAFLIFWVLMVGLPSFILTNVGRWLEKGSQPSPASDEKKDTPAE